MLFKDVKWFDISRKFIFDREVRGGQRNDFVVVVVIVVVVLLVGISLSSWVI